MADRYSGIYNSSFRSPSDDTFLALALTSFLYFSFFKMNIRSESEFSSQIHTAAAIPRRLLNGENHPLSQRSNLGPVLVWAAPCPDAPNAPPKGLPHQRLLWPVQVHLHRNRQMNHMLCDRDGSVTCLCMTVSIHQRHMQWSVPASHSHVRGCRKGAALCIPHKRPI